MTSTKLDSRESAREARELARAFRDMERMQSLTPSEKAREIVRNREKADTRVALESAARDMGISAAELASDIIAERSLMEDSPVKESREPEYGYSAVDSRERRSMVKAIIHAEHATRPDYRVARELLFTIGNEKGVVVSSLPTGEIAVFATYRAVDRDYAMARMEKAIAHFESARSRVVAAELAIEKAPLKKGTPGMQKELADAQRAMVIAGKRWDRANERVANSETISADGIRLEEKARFHSMDLEIAISLNRLTPAIEAWELPSAIVRRPFKEYVRPRIRRNPISPVECEVLRNEIARERAIVRAMVKAETERIIAEKSAAEKLEADNKKSANAASRKLANTIRMRNSRMAKRNSR